MAFLFKILILLSLGLSLGASALEACDTDTQMDASGEQMIPQPLEHLCHSNACHFGHCAHLQLQNAVILKSFPVLTARGNPFDYDSPFSIELRPLTDRPPIKV